MLGGEADFGDVAGMKQDLGWREWLSVGCVGGIGAVGRCRGCGVSV